MPIKPFYYQQLSLDNIMWMYARMSMYVGERARSATFCGNDNDDYKVQK